MVRTPITGGVIGRVTEVGADEAASVIEKAHAAFLVWRLVPPPKRGELEGHRRRTRVRIRRLESIYAACDQHHQLWPQAPAGSRRQVRRDVTEHATKAHIWSDNPIWCDRQVIDCPQPGADS